MPALDLGGLAGGREARRRVLPDDVQHVVAGVKAARLQDHQALVDQRADAGQWVWGRVDAGLVVDAGHVGDGVQIPATCEHGKTAEEPLFARPEQIVAPCDGVADRALS